MISLPTPRATNHALIFFFFYGAILLCILAWNIGSEMLIILGNNLHTPKLIKYIKSVQET